MSKPTEALDKVDLDLLKKLVSELEASLTAAEGIKERKDNVKDYIVELSKAQGLAAGVMKESSLLIMDIQALVSSVQAPSSKGDLISQLLGPLKGGGNTN